MVDSVDRKIIFLQIGLNCANFQPLMHQVRFARIARFNQRCENAVFKRNLRVREFGEGRMHPAALHKFSTQTVDLSQILAKCLRQKQPQILKSITKNWDKYTINDLEQVSPKQDHYPLSTFWSTKTFLSKLILSVWSGIYFWTLEIHKLNAIEKSMSSWKKEISSKHKYNEYIQIIKS